MCNFTFTKTLNMGLPKTETEVTKDDGWSKDSYLEMAEIMD